MASYLDSIATFDCAAMAKLALIYTKASASEPQPLSFQGWLLHQVLLFLTDYPQADLHGDAPTFIAWVEDRTMEPSH